MGLGIKVQKRLKLTSLLFWNTSHDLQNLSMSTFILAKWNVLRNFDHYLK